jgi:type II secretory pathway pseudopilin PulG
MAEYMEPERKIEKLLRAYAKKRRAAAGEPMQLHSATRRRLQGEVVRRAAQPEEEDSVSLWQLVRQHWAFLFGFAFMMFCLATMFLPVLSSAKRKAQNISAMNNLKQIGVAVQMAAADANGNLPASLDALTNQLGSAKDLIDPQSGKPFVYVAAGRNLDTLPTNEVLAYSPEGKKGRAVLLADGSVEYASPERFLDLTNPATVELALGTANERAESQSQAAKHELVVAEKEKSAVLSPQVVSPSAASAPMLPPPVAEPNSIQFGSRATQTFTREPSAGAQNLFKNNALSAKTAAVLANFQMEQYGERLRVVDGDGSVYEGTWQITKAIAQNAPAQAQTYSAESPTPQGNAQELNSANGGQMLAQSYSFQVTGTNLTLKKAVVFTGNLTVISGTAAAGQNAMNGNAAGNNPADKVIQQIPGSSSQQILWSNARIAGTATIAETNQIEINALPQ